MVDAIVYITAERLGNFVIQEAVFLHRVKDEVVWLQNELKWMRSFLKDAEEKQDTDERIRLWVSEIRDIAYDTEDVLDTFILKVKGFGNLNSGLVPSVKKCIGMSTKHVLYKLGKEIEQLKKRVLDISRKREVYGINNIGDTKEGTSDAIVRLRHLRTTTSYADDEYVVGFEDDAHFLKEKLLQEGPRRRVISILGMGGLGKTTLAKKVYNNIKSCFEWHAWICVSQEWRIRDLLERIIHSFKKLTNEELERIEKLKDDHVEQHLRELLEGRQYLLVIDDVWHREAWENLRRAFPENKNGSRIIITTRIEGVAELLDERTYVHKLRILRPDESWELFCKRAFPDDNGAEGDGFHYPPDMEKLGGEMVAKCGGLPLAIIVLGGLLARKQPHEWVAVKKHIWRELKNNSIHVSSLLALSFKDLPHQLKPCFLYLGLFPEDYIFNAEKLIRLWIAEGFIHQDEEGQDVEEVAENYLKELLGRSLIQIVQRNWRSTIATFRVHDLLRDLAVNKAREVNFLQIYDGGTSSTFSSTTSSFRRLAFHSGFEDYNSFDHSNPHVRTILRFNFNYREPLTLLYTRYRLLRVLDLQGVKFYSGRNSGLHALWKLIHLRYLGLNETIIDELPKSISNLQVLQILEVSCSYKVMRLPREICKLRQLRHLIGHFHVPFLLSEELTNLQSLNFVDIGLRGGGEGDMFGLNFIAKLRNLKFLSVKSSNSIASIQPLFHCRHLLKLKIDGRLDSLPEELHKFLSNLKYLELRNSCFKTDPMPILGMLPNLFVLYLDYTEDASLVLLHAKGFPQLQVLSINDISVRVKVQEEEEAMPRLRALSMPCGKPYLSERLRSLPDIEELNWEWEFKLPVYFTLLPWSGS